MFCVRSRVVLSLVRAPPPSRPFSRDGPLPFQRVLPQLPCVLPLLPRLSALSRVAACLRRAVAPPSLTPPISPRALPVPLPVQAPCRTRKTSRSFASGVTALLLARVRLALLCVALADSLLAHSPARAHPDASPRTPRTDRPLTLALALASFARPMAFYVPFALLALCTGQTVSPTTSPSPSPSCSASPGFFCSGGSALICPIGAYCAGGSALNVSCYPVTACTVAGLSAQPPCYWKVSTLAGSGVSGYANGLGGAAIFNKPRGVSFDSSNNIIVTEDTGCRIRNISCTAGSCVTALVAGSGSVSFNDGNGAVASFRYPSSAISDPFGNIYVGDTGNHRVRVIFSGLVGTLAGNGAAAYTNGVGASASFRSPVGLAFDNLGNIYVGDYSNHRIRYLQQNGTVSLVAGSGSPSWLDGVGLVAAFNYPQGVTFVGGLLYVADYLNHRLRVVSPNGTVTTLAGSTQGYADGQGAAALLKFPYQLASDLTGIYVTDAGNSRIRFVTMSGFVRTIIGNGAAASFDGFGLLASIDVNGGVSVSSVGALAIADYNNNRVRGALCIPCPSSFYCFSGAPVLCPAGSYCPLSSINATLCPKGSFSNAGASNCTLCPAGTSTSSVGSTSCQQCPGGHYCPAGTSSWARLNCGRGSYCPDGSGAPTPCPFQVPPTGGWGALQVQGPAFLVETAHCLNHCFWNFTSGDGMLSKC